MVLIGQNGVWSHRLQKDNESLAAGHQQRLAHNNAHKFSYLQSATLYSHICGTYTLNFIQLLEKFSSSPTTIIPNTQHAHSTGLILCLKWQQDAEKLFALPIGHGVCLVSCILCSNRTEWPKHQRGSADKLATLRRHCLRGAGHAILKWYACCS